MNETSVTGKLPYTDPKEAIKRIRKALKTICPTLSITMSKGTAWGWIGIRGSGPDGFTQTEKDALDSIGMPRGGNYANIQAGQDQAYWLKKLNA